MNIHDIKSDQDLISYINLNDSECEVELYEDHIAVHSKRQRETHTIITFKRGSLGIKLIDRILDILFPEED